MLSSRPRFSLLLNGLNPLLTRPEKAIAVVFFGTTLYRTFSYSSALSQLPNHRLYPQVDWDRIDAGDYAVVDPSVPSRILYLSEKDYIIQTRVALTNNKTLKVLASPGDSPKPAFSSSTNPDQSQNSPVHPFLEAIGNTGDQKTTSRKHMRERVRFLFYSKFFNLKKVNIDGSLETMITLDSNILGSVITRWTHLVSWWTRGHQVTTAAAADCQAFSSHIVRRFRERGVNDVISTLKICLFVINTYLGGKSMSHTQDLGKRIRLTNGLPSIIPLNARTGIRNRNSHYIRIWTSVANMYKGFKGVYGDIDLGTIIQKPTMWKDAPRFQFLEIGVVSAFWKMINHDFQADINPTIKVKKFFFTLKAGPNHPNSVLGAARDAYLWFNNPKVGSDQGKNLPLLFLQALGQPDLALMFRKVSKMFALQNDVLASFSQNSKLQSDKRSDIVLENIYRGYIISRLDQFQDELIKSHSRAFTVGDPRWSANTVGSTGWTGLRDRMEALMSMVSTIKAVPREWDSLKCKYVFRITPSDISTEMRRVLDFLQQLALDRIQPGFDARAQIDLMFNTISDLPYSYDTKLQRVVWKAPKARWVPNLRYFGLSDTIPGVQRGVLSFLHALYEPAGKIRIIAVVDYWTNFCLKPIHDWMFSVLKVLPTDATFDQEGALRRFAEKGHTVVWSIDLKAATDSIPLALYRVLFEPIFGETITSLWLEFLTDRPFLLPREFFGKERGGYRPPFNLDDSSDRLDFVRYGTGQPMGALSSWPSMALVHHLLVQYAAWMPYVRSLRGRLNPGAHVFDTMTWFEGYLVLGDDIVIADKRVAKEYLELLKIFGIKAGLHKSYISENGLFNFANQTYLGKENISPLSFKEEIGISTLAQRSEMAMRAVRRGWADMSKTSWVAPLVKLFFGPRLYKEVHLSLRKGVTHPIVNWVLSVLLVPGSARFAESVLPRASIKTYLATLLRKAVIWNKPIGSIDTLVHEQRSHKLQMSIIIQMVDKVYGDFLQARRSLNSVDDWFVDAIPVALEPLLRPILRDQVLDSLARWEAKYRQPLKSIQVVAKLPFALEQNLMDLGTGMSVSELTALIVKAQEALPTLPHYEDRPRLEEWLSTLKSDNTLDQIRRFNSIFTSLNAIDDLELPAAPGLDNPDYGPSLSPQNPIPAHLSSKE